MSTAQNKYDELPSHTNQARGIGEYAVAMLSGKHAGPSEAVLAKVEQFHLDSIACGVSALACGTNAPNVLRKEALRYALRDGSGVPMFGSTVPVPAEKAIAACASAVREWDSNGTNFGYNPKRNATAGEFGHNDFYSVAVAGAQLAGCDGRKMLLAMTVLDEIRGRLAEVFALKNYKIDHVVHGAIASAAVFGALLGATPEQIESAIGMTVAHYIPFRAIRAGHQLSDSKGASAAISTEAAILSMRRSMDGFVGPADIFRNPQAIFCLFEPPQTSEQTGHADHTKQSPFDLALATEGDDFAVMGMHFKLGLYEHQSAGAIQGVIDLLAKHPEILDSIETLRKISITIYEPAYGIIGDPAKRNPTTRQSADHSMVYIIATLLRKAHEKRKNENWDGQDGWRNLILLPRDYAEDETALQHPLTRNLMQKIDFQHGGKEFDDRYPDGIPTTVAISSTDGTTYDSGMVMYPEGHARNQTGKLNDRVQFKFQKLAALGVDSPESLQQRFTNLAERTAKEVQCMYDFELRTALLTNSTRTEVGRVG